MNDLTIGKHGMYINLTNIPTSQAIDLAKWHKTVKIRIKWALETKIHRKVSETKENIKVMRLKMIRAIYAWIIDFLEKENEKISISLNKFGLIDFEKKFTDEEIYRMMLWMPTKLKKDPKLILIQKMYSVSKRQAIKIREMIPKDVYTLTSKKC